MRMEPSDLATHVRTVLVDLEIVYEALRGRSLGVDDVCARIQEVGIPDVSPSEVHHRIEALEEDGVFAKRDGTDFVTREGADALRASANILACVACDLTPEKVRRAMPGGESIEAGR